MPIPIILTHGGAGAPAKLVDGPQRAADRGLAVLRAGRHALDGVIEATADLEDDPRFNAGTGSNLRLDGLTLEMDAAVMTDDGRSGAVACIQRVRNPIRVAADVRGRTPHRMLVGQGAVAFARRLGYPDYDPTTPKAVAKIAAAKRLLAGHYDPNDPDDRDDWQRIRGLDLRAVWNFELGLEDWDPDYDLKAGDTVGAVARDASGHFAAASSTGGTLVMLRGRVGDSPIFACGFYAGPAGAVTATGVGEEIVGKVLSKTVYDWMAAGVPTQEAVDRGLALFPHEVAVGILAVGKDDHGSGSNREMPVGVASVD